MAKDSTIPDYSDVETSSPKTENLQEINKLIELAITYQEEIEDLSEQLQEVKKKHQRLIEGDIPEIMNRVKMQKFKTTDGYEIELKPVVRSNLSEAKKPKAFEWLKENGHGAMIKKLLVISIAPGQEKKLQKLLGLKAMQEFEDRKMKGEVNTNALNAFIKREAKEDKSFPMSLFGAILMDQAKIKAPKK
jgi:hypothetical protein